MRKTILFVDDEANLLESVERSLRKRFPLETALGPKEALRLIKEKGPYAVVVSDLKMPEMNGLELLKLVREIHPDTVRIMLTGHGDMEVSMAAVNEGQIFRFLTKPCPAEVLGKAVADGLEQYRLVNAEKELLRGTLRGSINVLTEVLSLVNPEAFGKGERIKRYVGHMAKTLGYKGAWKLEMAAGLSQIGCVMITEEILDKKHSGEPFGAEEQQIWGMHPTVGASLLKNIPRMSQVGEYIQHQQEPFDADPQPPLESRILRIALDFDDLMQRGLEKAEAMTIIENEVPGVYDPDLIKPLQMAVFDEEGYIPKEAYLKDLKEGMVLDQDLATKRGQMLLDKGKVLSKAALFRIMSFHKVHGIAEPVLVRVPFAMVK